MPKGRTFLYTIWRACERWGLLPTGIKKNINEIENFDFALLLGYEQVRQLEEEIGEIKMPQMPKLKKGKR